MSEVYPALGVSQIEQVTIKPIIRVGEQVWHLKRDAADATAAFPHEKVNWIEQGCHKVFGQPFYACWIRGIVLGSPGTLEKSQDVMYIGFHSKEINMSPAYLTMDDLKRMHVYTHSNPTFHTEFVNCFLGIEIPEEGVREAISPNPPKQTRQKAKPNEPEPE